MKKALSIITLFFLTFNLFCYSGINSGEKNLKILKTRYFDIIYPESSEESAALLYQNADDIFLDVTKDYGIEPSFNIPIVITDNVDIYNAFYTPAPYNRIVLYDTSSSVLDDLSQSFSESFLSTFRHELTHAVTYNMKNGFWDVFSSIFGDVIVPGYFFVTSGMAEGAAVASESRGGEGRLNNEYSKHYVKQAKIEDKFPSFFEVQGSSNTSILSVFYYFNGAFHEHLQKKYGMEKYSELWSRVINLSRPGFLWSFEKTYGISVKDEWKLFIKNYKTPENVVTDILDEKIAKDFFLKSSEKFSIDNLSGSRFSSLITNDKGFYFTLDFPQYKSSKMLLFVPYEKMNDEKIKAKTLFSTQLTENIKPSKDGRFIVLSSLSTLDSSITSIVKIYDSVKKSFYKIKEDSLKDASIIQNDKDYYVVAHAYENQKNSLIIKKIILEKNKIKDVVDIKKEEMGENTFISCFVDIGSGEFSYIKKEGMNFFITIRDIEGNVLKEYKLPEKLIIKDLSYSDSKLFFSYVKKDTMPRLAFIDLDTNDAFFSDVDLSGGIFNPVFVKGKEKSEIIYKGTFFNEDRLLTLERNSIVLKNGETIKLEPYLYVPSTPLVPSFNNNGEEIPSSLSFEDREEGSSAKHFIKQNNTYPNISKISEDYKWYKDSYKGVLVPLSLYKGSFFGESYGGDNISTLLPFGLTYVTSFPWSTGKDDLALFTLGYSHLTNSLGFETIINKGTSTNLFYYTIDLKTEFDRKGWKQSGGNLTLGSSFNFGKLSSFSLQNDFSIVGGKSNNIASRVDNLDILTFWKKDLFETSAPLNDKMALNISNILQASYSNVHKSGTGLFERSGIRATIAGGYLYDSVRGKQALLTSDIAFYIPRLIPIVQKRDLTYNLPLVIDLSILPLQSDYGLTKARFDKAGRGVIDANVHTVLFGWDIQNVIPFVEALYFQKVYVTFGYDATIASYKGTKNGFQPLYFFEYLENLSNGKSIYLDSIYMQASVEITPNIGVLASGNTRIKLYTRLSYPLNVVPGDKKGLNFIFGYSSSF